MSRPGRPKLKRLTVAEAKSVRRLIAQMLDERAWTYADLDAALDRPARWSQNALARSSRLAYEHAKELVRSAYNEPLCSQALILESVRFLAALHEKYGPPAPALLAFGEDVPAIAAALSSHLAASGHDVPARLFIAFFERPFDPASDPPGFKAAREAIGLPAAVKNPREAMATRFAHKIWLTDFDGRDVINPALRKIVGSVWADVVRGPAGRGA